MELYNSNPARLQDWNFNFNTLKIHQKIFNLLKCFYKYKALKCKQNSTANSNYKLNNITKYYMQVSECNTLKKADLLNINY